MFEIYKGKRVLITGHRGFKGSWLSLWLSELGALVYGYGHLPNTKPSHFDLLYPNSKCGKEELLDNEKVLRKLEVVKPDIVFHLAAHAIVAKTFDDPRETISNNIMAATNLLDACRLTKSVKGTVLITTDKVYQDKGWFWGYRENDELGGVDPYSTSKVCIEYVVECYRKSFGQNIAVGRAGNVIGGGDWSFGRLIPDVMRAAGEGKTAQIHTLTATRPWQHVLEALSAYLMLGEEILNGKEVNRAFNFGPTGEMTVGEVLDTAQKVWPKVNWEVDDVPVHPHMVYLLKIDSSRANKDLLWKPRWSMEEAITKTVEWYKSFYQDGVIQSRKDISDYMRRAK